MRHLLSALLPLAALPLAGLAQTVTGRIVEAGGGAPVQGALVTLRAEGGGPGAEALSDSAGRFVVRAAAPGSYRLHAERIGHRGAASEPLQLARGQTLAYRVGVVPEGVVLEGIVATGDSRRCEVRREAGAAVAALWEEAGKSLRAARAGAPPRGFTYRVRHRLRELDARTGVVVAENADSARDRYSSTPFVSVALERGFLEQRGDTLLFHAPDAAALLSDPFLESHCFRVRTGSDEQAGLLGLAFEPMRRGERPDVEGVLWLDGRTAELRHVEFSYLDLPGALPDRRFGGRVEFRRLPEGHWIVPRWRIRMPVRSAAARDAGGARAPGTALAGADPTVLEESAEVLQLRTARGEQVELAAFASLAGAVHDSTRGTPLAGARVGLVGTEHAATTDPEGRYLLSGLPEGAYSLVFSHPRLDSLGYTPDPQPVRLVPPERLRRDLAIPSLGTLLAAGCPPGTGDAGRLTGRVASPDHQPLAGAALVATWPEGSAATVADSRGRYRFCRVPAGVPVRLVARAGDSAVVELSLTRAEVAVRDLTVRNAAGSAAIGISRLAGVLVDAQNGRPIAGAVVRVAGGARADTTDRRGRFEFPQLPVGSHSLSLEHPTYGAGVSRVELRAVPLEVELRVPRRTVVLEVINVQARRMDALDRAGHRAGRNLQVVTRSQVERKLGVARHVGDLLRTFNGIQIREINYRNTSFLKEVCIEPLGQMRQAGRGHALTDPNALGEAPRPLSVEGDVFPCEGVAVYLDDVPVGQAGEFLRDLSIMEIESIEYLRPSDAAIRLGSMGGRGAVLIYTRGNGPYVGVER